jgi:hypothetical protein
VVARVQGDPAPCPQPAAIAPRADTLKARSRRGQTRSPAPGEAARRARVVTAAWEQAVQGVGANDEGFLIMYKPHRALPETSPGCVRDSRARLYGRLHQDWN